MHNTPYVFLIFQSFVFLINIYYFTHGYLACLKTPAYFTWGCLCKPNYVMRPLNSAGEVIKNCDYEHISGVNNQILKCKNLQIQKSKEFL